MIYIALGFVMLLLILIFIVLILQFNKTSSIPVKPEPEKKQIQSRQSRDYRFSDSPLDFKQGWWGADVNFPLSSTKDLPIPSYDDSGNCNNVINPLSGQKVDVDPASAYTSSEKNDDHKLIPYMISFLFPQGTKDDSDKPYWSSLTIPPTSANSVNYAPPRLVTSSLPEYQRYNHDGSGNWLDGSGNNGFMDYNLAAYSPF